MQIWLQHLLPHHGLSRLVGLLANSTRPWIKNTMIRWFINAYEVDLSEAMHESLDQYATFNEFFIRALKPECRPIACDSNAFVSPVDGYISEKGFLHNGKLLQAKGREYSLQTLLGGDASWTSAFYEGAFFTAYLAPNQYHRVHMPIDGQLIQMIHVPGRIYSVSPDTTLHLPGLFTRNERVICIFKTKIGLMAMVLVGAMIVASINTQWHGTVTPPTQSKVNRWDYTDQTIALKCGEEMGYFQMGSTVIVLFEKDKVQWSGALHSGTLLKMGMEIGRVSTENAVNLSSDDLNSLQAKDLVD